MVSLSSVSVAGAGHPVCFTAVLTKHTDKYFGSVNEKLLGRFLAV